MRALAKLRVRYKVLDIRAGFHDESLLGKFSPYLSIKEKYFKNVDEIINFLNYSGGNIKVDSLENYLKPPLGHITCTVFYPVSTVGILTTRMETFSILYRII